MSFSVKTTITTDFTVASDLFDAIWKLTESDFAIEDGLRGSSIQLDEVGNSWRNQIEIKDVEFVSHEITSLLTDENDEDTTDPKILAHKVALDALKQITDHIRTNNIGGNWYIVEV